MRKFAKGLQICVLIIACVVCSDAKAQTYAKLWKTSPLSCWQVGVYAGMGQYRGDYHAFMSALRDFDYKLGYGLDVRYDFNDVYSPNKLSGFLDRRVSFTLGVRKLKASSNKEDYGDIMTMDIMEASAMVQVNIFKYSSDWGYYDGGHNITPYVEGGLALSGFRCDNRMDNNPNVPDKYKDDGYKFSPVAILGWGIKVATFKGITLALDGSYRFAFKNDIDHNNSRIQRNDQYYYVGAQVWFNLGELFDK